MSETSSQLDILRQTPRVDIFDFPASSREQFKYDLANAQLDPIMLANARFNKDLAERPHMSPINLAIGVIADQETGKPWKPRIVEASFYETSAIPERWGYLPPAGHAGFLRAINQWWIMGPELWEQLGGTDRDIKPDSLVWAQSLGGTGAVRMSAEMHARQRDRQNRTAFVEVPSWPNYAAILRQAGFARMIMFNRANPDGTWYDHDAYIEVLKKLPPDTFIIMQGSGFNGDGIDKTREEHDEIVRTLEGTGRSVLVDTAYDRIAKPLRSLSNNYLLRKLIEAGSIDVYSSYSLSKNCGLYGDRLGAWAYVPKDSANAHRNKQLQRYIESHLIRPDPSSAPRHAAVSMHRILNNDDSRNVLQHEITGMQDDIVGNQELLVRLLGKEGIVNSNINNAVGLFATPLISGFRGGAVNRIIEEHAVHPLDSSRLNFGMRGHDIPRAVAALVPYLQNC